MKVKITWLSLLHIDGSKMYSQHATEVLSNYLFCHHLEKDSKHFISNTNNALHHSCGDEESLRTWTTLHRYTFPHMEQTPGSPTRLVFLNSFVFKVSKHDLEPVRIIGSQHPETEEAEEILRVVSALKTQIHHFNAVMTILSLPGELTSRKQSVKWSRPDVF